MNDKANLISPKTVDMLLSLWVFKEQKAIRQWHTAAAQVPLLWADSRGLGTGPIGLQPHYSADEEWGVSVMLTEHRGLKPAALQGQKTHVNLRISYQQPPGKSNTFVGHYTVSNYTCETTVVDASLLTLEINVCMPENVSADQFWSDWLLISICVYVWYAP